MNMCKFKVGDYARVTEPTEHHFDEVGLAVSREPDEHYAYELRFADGNTNYYPANHRTLAPGEHK